MPELLYLVRRFTRSSNCFGTFSPRTARRSSPPPNGDGARSGSASRAASGTLSAMGDATLKVKLTTDELLYGTDPTPRIVAVEPSGSDRVLVYRRDEGGNVGASSEPFEPWLLATRSEPWAALRSRPQIEELAGDHPLRFLVRFPTWQAYGEATRAARDAGERLVDVSSPVEQYLIASGRTLFKGMVYEDLCRLQLDIETTGFDPRDPTAQVIVVALKTSYGHEELLVLGESEADLIAQLTERILALDPDVIEGHNLFNFDLPFLTARA